MSSFGGVHETCLTFYFCDYASVIIIANLCQLCLLSSCLLCCCVAMFSLDEDAPGASTAASSLSGKDDDRTPISEVMDRLQNMEALLATVLPRYIAVHGSPS